MRHNVVLDDLSLSVDRGGSGQPLIWGHGLTSSMDLEGELLDFDWASIASHTDVIRYDARGHGRSTLTPELSDYSWQRLAEDQLALADALDVTTYIAGGASMGAGTALHAAVAAPSRIMGLVLMIPPTAWETRDIQRALYLDRADRIAAGNIEQVIEESRRIPPPDPFGSEWHDRMERNMRSADHQQMAHVLRGAATADFPTRDQVRNIAIPVLILAWSGDAGHPVSSAEALHQLIPSSVLAIATSAHDVASWSWRITEFLGSLM
jgi:pimeloyl-ACP methyl ester carboxylesterase